MAQLKFAHISSLRKIIDNQDHGHLEEPESFSHASWGGLCP